MNNIVNDIINMSYIIDRRDTMLLSILVLGWEHKEKIINTFETKEILSQMECGDSVKFTFKEKKTK